MAVVAIDRISWTGGRNRLWQRVYELGYRVECDSRFDGPAVIRAAAVGVLPQIGDFYNIGGSEVDGGSFVEDEQFELEYSDAQKNIAVWKYTVKFGPYDASQFPENPIDWPIKVRFGGTRFERLCPRDDNGDPILMSNKLPPADPVTRDDSRSTIIVTRNELVSTFDFELAKSYRDTTNDAAWNGFAARTVKCGIIETGEPQYNSVAQVWYYAVQYPFEINEDTWDVVILDQGLMKLDGSSPPKPIPITRKGQPVTDPVLLDGSGHELATTGTPVFVTKRVYPMRDFSVFNIDLATALGR